MTNSLEHLKELSTELNKENKRLNAELEAQKKQFVVFEEKFREKELEISSLERQIESADERLQQMARSTKNLRSINEKLKKEAEGLRKTTSIQLVVIFVLFIAIAGLYMIQQ